MAETLAANPRMAETIARQHVNDGSGHCEGCGSYRRPRWPCAVLALATRCGPARGPRQGVAVAILPSGPVEVATDGG